MEDQYDNTLSTFTHLIQRALNSDVEIVTTRQFQQEYAHGDCVVFADIMGMR